MPHMTLSRTPDGKLVVGEALGFHEARRSAGKTARILPFEEVAASSPRYGVRTAYNTPPLLEMSGVPYRVLKFPMHPDPDNGLLFWSSEKAEAAVEGRYADAGLALRRRWLKAVPKVLEGHAGMGVEYAYRDGDGVVVVLGAGTTGWFSRFGVGALAGAAKVVKRLSQVNRGALLWGEVPLRDVKLAVVEGDETELDGGIVFSRAWLELGLANAAGKGLAGAGALKAAGAWTNFNARWFIPGREDSLAKGQGFLRRGSEEGFVLWTHACNLKKGLVVQGDTVRFLMEPQYAKDGDRTNLQFIAHQPHIFPTADVAAWFKEDLRRKTERIESGKVAELCAEEFDEFEELAEAAKARIKERHNSRVRRKLGEWVRLGRSPFELPHTYEKAIAATVASMIDDRCSIRARIPGAVKQQLICTAMAQLIAPDFHPVPEDRVYAWRDYGMHVVGNKTYAGMRENHGGPDQDDFYTFVYRKVEGKVGAFVLRVPNEDGNYDWLEVVGRTAEGVRADKILECRAPRDQWPIQKKAMPAAKTGFPKEVKKNAVRKESPYSLAEFAGDINKPSTNPGGYINAGTLAALAGRVGARLPLGYEDAVDACQQGGSAAQIFYVQEAAANLAREVVLSKAAIPPCFWQARFRWDRDLNRLKPNLDEGHWFHALYVECRAAADQFLERTERHVWSQYAMPLELAAYGPGRNPKLWDAADRWRRAYENALGTARKELGVARLEGSGWDRVQEIREATWLAVKGDRKKFVPWVAARLFAGNQKGVPADYVLYTCDELWRDWIAFIQEVGAE